jgi:hypothetical protein
MFGHGPLCCPWDFCEGAGLLGVVGVELDVEPELVVPLLVLPFVELLLVELGAAAAPVMPAAAPPAASAPATIVAPSILETFIGMRPPWGLGASRPC